MTRKSLSLRIIAFSGFWIALALIGTGALLRSFYQSHIEAHYDAHVGMHMEEMIAAARLDPDGSLSLAYPPSDPRYQVLSSGWYWEIRHRGRVLARSPSLGDGRIEFDERQVTPESRARVVPGPDGSGLRVQTRLVPAGTSGEQLLLVASAPLARISDDVAEIGQHMALAFSVLAAGLLLAVALQVRIALRPIRAISRGIGAVYEGRAEKVEGEFPREIQPLVKELNNLLEHNSTLLRRARNQLGDLAHSIKNPLAVINNEARSMNSETGRLILQRSADIAASVDHHLSRARAFGTTNVLGSRVQVRPVAEDLVFALQRIYQGRNLEFDIGGVQDCVARCEAQDLEEMLGNLMDNACKWARRRVVVDCRHAGGQVRLSVEDDGPGIPEEKIPRVLQRGQRLDESTQGHGLGLGIVQDIVELYGGTLHLGPGGLGGLRAELTLPGP